MKQSTVEIIKNSLYDFTKRANTLNSIEEKRQFYIKALRVILPFIDADEVIDPNSKEVEQIIVDNFLSIGIETPQIFEDEGYVPWLQDARKDIAWSFYNRYEKYLIQKKKWKTKAVASIDKSSDIILDHMANPKTSNLFSKQGLVIGDIQSGKTANYTALINKAFDSGYKIVVVLAGLTRDLRNQTQGRLDKEVLGYETKNNGRGKQIGVGEFRHLNIEGLTYSDDKKDFGDMKKFFSTHTLDEKSNPILAVVKKNVSVLKHLDKFLTSSLEDCYDENGKLKIPVLIIDDEVDQASVDTKNSESIDEASAINKNIRIILSHLSRYSYVGYTATPFANVFIDPDKNNDIYPKDFILCLQSNEDYCGIKEYFGVDIVDEDNYTSDSVKDLFCNIEDYEELTGGEKMSSKSDINNLNSSLEEAIRSFILAASIKKSRGIDGHNSMLIHIARFKNPASTLKPKVEEYVNDIYHRLKFDTKNMEDEFKSLWENNFKEVSKKRLGENFKDDWNDIEKYLLKTTESIKLNIVVLNGDSNDFLDYSISSTGDYIVIGGDKLSRGLTIEGLVVSYYYRNSKAYDSLLQMGRWFGYRKGWIDVCRVYTTIKFMNDFITVGKVLQKFKADIQEMYDMRLNPRDVGQRIMYSPNLIPTTRNKMRSVETIRISFSNSLQQIITFDRKNRDANLKLTCDFISNLKNSEIRKNKNIVFNNVSPKEVLNYLKKYKDCSDDHEYGNISIKNWISYIENLNQKDELTNWTVVLHSNDNDGNLVKIGNYEVLKPSRTLRDPGDSRKFSLYTVKTNNVPVDFKEIYNESDDEYKKIDHFDPKVEYRNFGPKQALMVIYIVDLYEKELTNEFDPKTSKQKAVRGKLIDDGVSTCAPAIWFSKTVDFEESATVYYANKDFLKIKKDDYDSEDE